MKLESIHQSVTEVDSKAGQLAHEKLSQLAMPPWALGRILDLAQDLVAITGNTNLKLDRKLNIVMAGDHGVVAENISAYPKDITKLMVSTMLKGGAAINVLAKQMGSDLMVVDMGVEGSLPSWNDASFFIDKKIQPGTMNMTQGPAMSLEDARQSVQSGIDLVYELKDQYDLFAIGEMGIGNTTAATAILCSATGLAPDQVTGPGTGLNDEQVNHKAQVIQNAIHKHQPDSMDGLDILSKVGGYEIGGMAGVILGAASLKKPIIIDGLISSSAALIAQKIVPLSTDYLIASHQGVEPGHIKMLEALEKKAYLDLGLRLGEGTGAALVMPLIDSALEIMHSMFSLEEVLES